MAEARHNRLRCAFWLFFAFFSCIWIIKAASEIENFCVTHIGPIGYVSNLFSSSLHANNGWRRKSWLCVRIGWKSCYQQLQWAAIDWRALNKVTWKTDNALHGTQRAVRSADWRSLSSEKQRWYSRDQSPHREPSMKCEGHKTRKIFWISTSRDVTKLVDGLGCDFLHHFGLICTCDVPLGSATAQLGFNPGLSDDSFPLFNWFSLESAFCQAQIFDFDFHCHLEPFSTFFTAENLHYLLN